MVKRSEVEASAKAVGSAKARGAQQCLMESISVQRLPVAKQPLDVQRRFMEKWNSGDDEAMVRYSQWVNRDVHKLAVVACDETVGRFRDQIGSNCSAIRMNSIASDSAIVRV